MKIIFILLTLFFTNTGFCQDSTASEEPYTENQGKYSLHIPSGWHIDDPINSNTIIIKPDKNSDSVVAVIKFYSVNKSNAAKSLFSNSLKELNERKKLTEMDVKINILFKGKFKNFYKNSKCIAVEKASSKDSEGYVLGLNYFIQNGEKVVTIYVFSYMNNSMEIKKTYDACVRSIRFL